MSEKKDAAITVHLTSVKREQLIRLATETRGGIGASEYVFEIIDAHLEQLRYETQVRAEIFNLKGN